MNRTNLHVINPTGKQAPKTNSTLNVKFNNPNPRANLVSVSISVEKAQPAEKPVKKTAQPVKNPITAAEKTLKSVEKFLKSNPPGKSKGFGANHAMYAKLINKVKTSDAPPAVAPAGGAPPANAGMYAKLVSKVKTSNAPPAPAPLVPRSVIANRAPFGKVQQVAQKPAAFGAGMSAKIMPRPAFTSYSAGNVSTGKSLPTTKASTAVSTSLHQQPKSYINPNVSASSSHGQMPSKSSSSAIVSYAQTSLNTTSTATSTVSSYEQIPNVKRHKFDHRGRIISSFSSGSTQPSSSTGAKPSFSTGTTPSYSSGNTTNLETGPTPSFSTGNTAGLKTGITVNVSPGNPIPTLLNGFNPDFKRPVPHPSLSITTGIKTGTTTSYSSGKTSNIKTGPIPSLLGPIPSLLGSIPGLPNAIAIGIKTGTSTSSSNIKGGTTPSFSSGFSSSYEHPPPKVSTQPSPSKAGQSSLKDSVQISDAHKKIPPPSVVQLQNSWDDIPRVKMNTPSPKATSTVTSSGTVMKSFSSDFSNMEASKKFPQSRIAELEAQKAPLAKASDKKSDTKWDKPIDKPLDKVLELKDRVQRVQERIEIRKLSESSGSNAPENIDQQKLSDLKSKVQEKFENFQRRAAVIKPMPFPQPNLGEKVWNPKTQLFETLEKKEEKPQKSSQEQEKSKLSHQDLEKALGKRPISGYQFAYEDFIEDVSETKKSKQEQEPEKCPFQTPTPVPVPQPVPAIKPTKSSQESSNIPAKDIPEASLDKPSKSSTDSPEKSDKQSAKSPTNKSSRSKDRYSPETPPKKSSSRSSRELPEGWKAIRHSSGISLYINESLGIGTLSRPIQLEDKSEVTKVKPFPSNSWIPCKALKRLKQRYDRRTRGGQDFEFSHEFRGTMIRKFKD